jgi:hypothetical protein
MTQKVCMGALLKCSFGSSPSPMIVTPEKQELIGTPAATIMDNKPIANIVPFGMCSSPSNPAVVAALGSPMPCMPVTTAPWVPGSPTVLLSGQPVLTKDSMCMCAYGGVITVDQPGQMTVTTK